MKDGSMDQAFALEEEEYLDLEEADTSIRLYLDSAAVKEWETWAETGLFYGARGSAGLPAGAAAARMQRRGACRLLRAS